LLLERLVEERDRAGPQRPLARPLVGVGADEDDRDTPAFGLQALL